MFRLDFYNINHADDPVHENENKSWLTSQMENTCRVYGDIEVSSRMHAYL